MPRKKGILSREELGALAKITSPSVSNAIEMFNVRPRNKGFMSPEIRCIFPDLGAIVGYACTGVMRADRPSKSEDLRVDCWEDAVKIPEPRVAVIHDLDAPHPVGSFWGEVMGNAHRALGFVGAVTDGGVRDLDESHAIGFKYFASQVLVSHAYIHLVDYGKPVKVGGVTVRPGDLIHGDKHGVIVIPHEVARDVARAASEIDRMERIVIDYCKSPNFTLRGLKKLMREHKARMSKPFT